MEALRCEALGGGTEGQGGTTVSLVWFISQVM